MVAWINGIDLAINERTNIITTAFSKVNLQTRKIRDKFKSLRTFCKDSLTEPSQWWPPKLAFTHSDCHFPDEFFLGF